MAAACAAAFAAARQIRKRHSNEATTPMLRPDLRAKAQVEAFKGYEHYVDDGKIRLSKWDGFNGANLGMFIMYISGGSCPMSELEILGLWDS